MSNYVFSATTNAFYPLDMKSLYEQAGSWPADGVEISDEDYFTYRGFPPAGKVLGSLNGYPAWVDIVYDPDEAYSTTLNTLRVNGLNATIAIQAPYSFEEPESWWAQVLEAEAWTADNNYVPVILNQMVAASGGHWALSNLVATILSNATAWRSCTGNILGQLKNKRMVLSALKAAVDAGTADVHDIVNFDCTINIPSAVITDKYA
ncbi:hypothetical protein [Phytobacter diazotrophicus]|uniref:hypothetical protein n=1 Tax=Phytobacter diazotrophicus TaxID=395631 RepID=UPI002FFA3B50